MTAASTQVFCGLRALRSPHPEAPPLHVMGCPSERLLEVVRGQSALGVPTADLLEALCDAVGSFAIAHALPGGGIRLITDCAGSIPLYCAAGDGVVAAGPLAHEVATATGLREIDPIAALDFILNGTICFPHSLFRGVAAAPAGSSSTICAAGLVQEHFYFQPTEGDECGTCEDWGAQLREAVEQEMAHALCGADTLRMLFSGGEDSRTLAAMLPPDVDAELVTFSNAINREVRIARAAAFLLGRPHRFVERPTGYYTRDLRGRALLTGPGRDTNHLHVYEPLTRALRGVDRIVGGHGADTLFKADHFENVGFSPRRGRVRMGQAPTRPTRRKVTPATGHPLLSPDAAARVDARRMEHHRRLQEHRPESAGNWHCMWPLGTQQAAISAYVASLLQGLPIVEPFLGGAAYRVACRLPSDVTVGGDAFHAAFRDVIGVLGWLPTSGHGVPHLRGRLGVGVRRTIRRTRKLRDGAAQHLLALRGRTLPHQGAWAPPSRQESAQGIRQLLTQDEVDGLLHALQPVFASGSHPVDMLDALPWRARVRAASLAAFL